MAPLRHALAVAALLVACAPSLSCGQAAGAVDPADPELADAAATVERAEAAVDRLGPKRARTLSRTVRSIPALAVGLRGQSRGLQATITELEGAKRELGAEESELEVRIALPADVLFDVDSAAIRTDAAAALAHLATVIRGYGGAVRLIGHTDADGGEEHNQDLSERRATSVRDWLVATGDIDPARLATEGRGESEPVVANDTPANKQRNRRVDVVIAKR